LPSVIAGVATVPVVYLLGDAIAGRRCAVTAAALFAVMPMAIYYGSEARPYGLLIFLITLSTLALLRALEAKEGLRWWLLYGLACTLALYTHYIAGIAIAMQAGWALVTQVDRRREILLANGAVGLAFLPWVPRVDDNTSGASPIGVFNVLHPLTLKNIVTDPIRLLIGHPTAPFDQVPGLVSIGLTCLAGVAIAVGLLRPSLLQSWRAAGSLELPRVGWLLVSLTAGTVVASLVYSALADATIYSSRHMITVVPYVCLLGGAAVSALRGRVALLAAGALVLAALIGSLRMLITYPRPDLKAAASTIAERAAPGTPVVQPWRFGHNPNRVGFDPLGEDLAIHLDSRFPLSHQVDSNDWPKALEVYGVATGPLQAGQLDAAAKGAGDQLVETLSFAGLYEVTLRRYSRGGSGVVGGQSSAIGAYLQQHPEELRAYLEQHPAERKRFQQALRARQGSP
jgi:hypothetical protein